MMADQGELIDKKTYDQHVGELHKTLSILSPGAARPVIDNRTATNAQVLGLDRTDEKTQKVNEALFGKRWLRE